MGVKVLRPSGRKDWYIQVCEGGTLISGTPEAGKPHSRPRRKSKHPSRRVRSGGRRRKPRKGSPSARPPSDGGRSTSNSD